MQKISIILSVMAFMASCAAPEQPSTVTTSEPVTDGVFIHMTHGHDNPHRVLMPLQMAAMMAQDKDVLIYMDIDAVKLLTQDAEDVSYAHFTSLHESLQKLLDMGVTLFACPGCMRAHGLSPEELREGIQVAQKDKFFTFTKGNIVSLSY